MKKLAFVLVLVFCSATVFANPFFGATEGEVDIPSVRTPTSSGPLLNSQKTLRDTAASTINSFTENPNAKSLFILFGICFLYGILHAMGPGHRKTIIFSLFLGRKSKALEPLAAGFFSATVHAGSGIIIVAILSIIKGTVTNLSDTDKLSTFFDIATFGVIIIIACILTILKIISIIKNPNEEKSLLKIKNIYEILAISSLVPCPGATMLLLFSLYANLPAIGIFCVVSMSIGMAVVISCSAYFAYLGMTGLFLKLKTNEKVIRKVSDILELVSYASLFVFSLYMAWPAICSIL